MKKLLFQLFPIFVFLLFFSNLVDAGQIDSLKKQIKIAVGKDNKIELYNQLATTYAKEGKGKEALAVYQKLLSLAADNKRLLVSTYNEIGNVHADLGENDQAFKSYQTALKLCSNNYLALQAIINKNIGALFASWKKLDQALSYYKTAENLAKKANDLRTVADLSNNKATVYEQQNKYQLAEESYQKALTFYLNHQIYDRIALTYNNLAILAKVQKRFLPAISFYQKSVKNATKANNKWLSAAIGNNLGNLLSEMGDYAASEKALNDALAIENEIEAKELIFETLENLADNEKRRGNYPLAYKLLKQANEARNEYINTENTKEVVKLKEEFDAENRQKAIEILNKESKIQKLTLNKKNNTIFVMVSLFVAVLVIAFLMFSKYKLRQENKIRLAALETKSQVQAEKLRISQELHDNIGAQLSFINGSIQSLASADSENQKLQQTQKITQNTIKELRSTVWLINQQEFCLEEFVVKLREYLKPYYGSKPQISIENQSDKDYTLEPIIATNLFRIIQELVNNAIKYAEANTLEVNLVAELSTLKISVIDNGIGYDTNAKSSGYGLKNIASRVDAIQGTYKIETALGKGTRIHLNIPI